MCVQLSGSLACPDIFCGKRMCAVKRGLNVQSLCMYCANKCGDACTVLTNAVMHVHTNHCTVNLANDNLRSRCMRQVLLLVICCYSQTSLIRSSFIRIPRHPDENHWLPICSIYHACIQYVCSIIRFPRLYFLSKTVVCGYARSDCIPYSLCLKYSSKSPR